jgi:hypothetical protein
LTLTKVDNRQTNTQRKKKKNVKTYNSWDSQYQYPHQQQGYQPYHPHQPQQHFQPYQPRHSRQNSAGERTFAAELPADTDHPFRAPVGSAGSDK